MHEDSASKCRGSGYSNKLVHFTDVRDLYRPTATVSLYRSKPQV